MTVKDLFKVISDGYFQFQSEYSYNQAFKVDIAITRKLDLTYFYVKDIEDREVVNVKAIAIDTFFVIYK